MALYFRALLTVCLSGLCLIMATFPGSTRGSATAAWTAQPRGARCRPTARGPPQPARYSPRTVAEVWRWWEEKAQPFWPERPCWLAPARPQKSRERGERRRVAPAPTRQAPPQAPPQAQAKAPAATTGGPPTGQASCVGSGTIPEQCELIWLHQRTWHLIQTPLVLSSAPTERRFS